MGFRNWREHQRRRRAYGKLQNNFGYQGKELQSSEFYDGTGLEEYDFEARYYDPQLSRWHNQDPEINEASPYAAMSNNPVNFIDPDGRNPLVIAAIIGAAFGAYSGYKIGEAKGAKGWSMAGYMLGGAAVGAVSGYAGASVAAGGGFMASTTGIMFSSLYNSVGMSVLSGGMMSPNISFGVASFDFGTGEFGYLGKKGNSFLTNLGYTFGALANLQDIVTGLNGGNYEYQYELDKGSSNIGHGNVREVTTDASGAKVSTVKISVANVNSIAVKHKGILGALEWVWKANFKKYSGGGELWTTGISDKGWVRIPLRLNTKIVDWMFKNLSKNRGLWDVGKTRFGINFGCVSYSARALWTAGIPTIPIINFLGPRILWLQLVIRHAGIASSPYLYNIDR